MGRPNIPLLYVLSMALLLTACNRHGSSALPATGSVAQTSTVGSVSTRQFYPNVALVGKSADGTYVVRSLHVTGVRVHQAFSFETANGLYTQVEYSTPYGLLTLVQVPKRAVSAPPPPIGNEGHVIETPVVATGVLKSGGHWFIARSNSRSDNLIHLEFSDSTIDATLPGALDVGTIERVIAGMY